MMPPPPIAHHATGHRRDRRYRPVQLLLLLVPLLLCGCVERWLLIKSEPTGSRVFLDSFAVATTPARIAFDHFGTRELIVHYAPPEGSTQIYSSQRRTIELDAPWYQWFPIDFFAEYLVPWTVVFEHEEMVTLAPTDVDALARQLREFAKQHGVDIE